MGVPAWSRTTLPNKADFPPEHGIRQKEKVTNSFPTGPLNALFTVGNSTREVQVGPKPDIIIPPSSSIIELLMQLGG